MERPGVSDLMGRAAAIAGIMALALVVSVALFDRTASPTPFVAIGEHAGVTVDRDPDVPDLPFPDNPDPSLCGKPEPWLAPDDRAWLNGVWDGVLIEPEVLLYDGHLRSAITGSAPHGSPVRIVLSQTNPVLDYYFVEVVGADGLSGWVPGPFVSFEPVDS
jgi:hypothetical protein